MGAAWYRAKGELRRRWRATLLLVLLVGVAGGAVLTTVAGARRSSSAYDRFRQETLASDLDVAFDGEPGDDLEAAADAARGLSQVQALARLNFPYIVPAGSGFYPYLDFTAAVNVEGSDEGEIDRPRLVEGRVPDPGNADEVAITETYARESGLEVGDEVEFESFAPEQLEPLFTGGDAGPPAGPEFTFEVTAIFEVPAFLSESSGDFQPKVFLTPAFTRAHGDEVATYPGGLSLRLHDGAADADEVVEALREMFAGTTLEITPASEIDRKIDSSIDVIVSALLLCALVAALAGSIAIAQTLTRHLAAQGASERWLSALGMTRGERVASQVATVVPVAVLGAVVAVVVSVLASPLMPVGVARRAEPDPGIAIDGTVLLVGSIGIVFLVTLLSALAAVSVTRRTRLVALPGATAGGSRSMLPLHRTGLGPSATIGVGMAVEPRGGTAWPVRSALLGVAFGVAGVIAVLVFVASVDTLIESPDRYGSPFDAAVSGFSGDVLEEGGDELLADPEVIQMGLGSGGLARVGDEEVNTHALESLKGDMALTLLDGHEPRGGAEVVLGTTTLDTAGVGIGDELEIDGAGGSLRATVVGTAVFPVVDERSSPGRGVLLGRDDLERISTADELNADVLIKWADGVDAEAANAELGERTGTEVFAPRLPSDVNNLREVKSLGCGSPGVTTRRWAWHLRSSGFRGLGVVRG